MKLNELTLSNQTMSLGLKTLLEEGFKSEYYKDYNEFLGDWDGEETHYYELDSYSGAWEALDYVSTKEWYDVDDELKVRLAQPAMRSTNGDHDEYYAVLAFTDGTNTRYFQRLVYYSSYDGGALSEGENAEVFPEEVIVTEWRNV